MMLELWCQIGPNIPNGIFCTSCRAIAFPKGTHFLSSPWTVFSQVKVVHSKGKLYFIWNHNVSHEKKLCLRHIWLRLILTSLKWKCPLNIDSSIQEAPSMWYPSWRRRNMKNYSFLVSVGQIQVEIAATDWGEPNSGSEWSPSLLEMNTTEYLVIHKVTCFDSFWFSSVFLSRLLWSCAHLFSVCYIIHTYTHMHTYGI